MVKISKLYVMWRVFFFHVANKNKLKKENHSPKIFVISSMEELFKAASGSGKVTRMS